MALDKTRVRTRGKGKDNFIGHQSYTYRIIVYKKTRLSTAITVVTTTAKAKDSATKNYLYLFYISYSNLYYYSSIV